MKAPKLANFADRSFYLKVAEFNFADRPFYLKVAEFNFADRSFYLKFAEVILSDGWYKGWYFISEFKDKTKKSDDSYNLHQDLHEIFLVVSFELSEASISSHSSSDSLILSGCGDMKLEISPVVPMVGWGWSNIPFTLGDESKGSIDANGSSGSRPSTPFINASKIPARALVFKKLDWVGSFTYTPWMGVWKAPLNRVKIFLKKEI